jgi:hypothetical protein
LSARHCCGHTPFGRAPGALEVPERWCRHISARSPRA